MAAILFKDSPAQSVGLGLENIAPPGQLLINDNIAQRGLKRTSAHEYKRRIIARRSESDRVSHLDVQEAESHVVAAEVATLVPGLSQLIAVNINDGIMDAINNLGVNLNNRLDSLDNRLTRMEVKQHNSVRTRNTDTLQIPRNAQNLAVPGGFPTTAQAINGLTIAQIAPIEAYYGLPGVGPIAERRRAVRMAYGVGIVTVRRDAEFIE